MRRGLILFALLASACSPVHRVYDSTARTIRLRETPLPVECQRGEQLDKCVLMLEQDWETLVIDYKGKCLQLGGTPAACQTEDK